MTDKSKFEQMLEKLVADDKTAAEEIFHNIVCLLYTSDAADE